MAGTRSRVARSGAHLPQVRPAPARPARRRALRRAAQEDEPANGLSRARSRAGTGLCAQGTLPGGQAGKRKGNPGRPNSPPRLATWCPGRDSNSHALRRRPLKTVCLPVPPPGRDRERLRSTAPEILQGCFFDGAAGFAGGICVFCAGIAAPPVAGAGAVCPVGTLGCVEPLSSGFFFAASCAAMLRRARSTESLCEDRQASVKDVTMKMIAQTVVTLLRKVTEPRPPKTGFADPPPPAKAAIASPFPGWSRMTKMRKTLTTTWMVTTNANMRGARITWGSVPGKPPFPEGLLASLVPAWQSRAHAGAARSSADQHRDPRLRRASVRLLRSHARPDDRGRLARGGSVFAQAARPSGGGCFRGSAGGQRPDVMRCG